MAPKQQKMVKFNMRRFVGFGYGFMFSGAQGLHLTLYSDLIPGGVRESILGARDGTGVGGMQDTHFTPVQFL